MLLFIGVTIASDLRWHTAISAKATRVLNFVRRNVYHFSPEAKSLAYLSLVRPHLEFAAAAWDSHLIKDVMQLEGIQRWAARFASHGSASSASALFDRFQWPILSSRRKNTRLALFYRAVHGLSAIPIPHFQKPTRFTGRSNIAPSRQFSFARILLSCLFVRLKFHSSSLP